MEMSGNPVVRLAMREVIAEVNALESATPGDRERRHARLRNSVKCLSDELCYSLEEAWGNPVEPVEDGASSSEPSRNGMLAAWRDNEATTRYTSLSAQFYSLLTTTPICDSVASVPQHSSTASAPPWPW
jgi:hypothetical protein